MTTGERIKEARKRAGLTQKELADKLGVQFQNISSLERDERNPKLETLEKIAAALSIRVFDLMDPITQESYDKGFSEGVGAEEWNSHVIEQLLKEEGYTYSDAEMQLIKSFSSLNPTGQQKAVERVEELTEIPKYQRSGSTATPTLSWKDNTPAPETPSERKETPPQADAQDGEEA